MPNARLEIYPFQGRKLVINSTEEEPEINPELSQFIEEQWNPSYSSAWMPHLRKLKFTPEKVFLEAGVMSYKQTAGMLKAIEQEKPFAPKLGGVNNLSLSIIPITSDNHAVLTRRSLNVSHAPGVWNFPGGYMASHFISGGFKGCDDPKYKYDWRLFDPQWQLRRRAHNQEFHGLEEDDISFEEKPVALAWGFLHSQEPEIAYVARLKKTAEQMKGHIRSFEVEKGKSEHSRVDFVPITQLETLLANQGDLLSADPRTYETDDPTKIILLDDNIGELIGGGYSRLTGKAVPIGVADYLNNKGWDIRTFVNLSIHRTEVYLFPTSF